jgi:hypothetical protein
MTSVCPALCEFSASYAGAAARDARPSDWSAVAQSTHIGRVFKFQIGRFSLVLIRWSNRTLRMSTSGVTGTVGKGWELPPAPALTTRNGSGTEPLRWHHCGGTTVLVGRISPSALAASDSDSEPQPDAHFHGHRSSESARACGWRAPLLRPPPPPQE